MTLLTTTRAAPQNTQARPPRAQEGAGMKTGHHGGLPVYGPRPTTDAMAARAKRDGFDPATLRPALQLSHRGGYYVEVWARPSPYPFLRLTGKVVEHNGIMIPDVVDDPGWLVYRLRRDGKVQCSGQTESADRIRFEEQTEPPFPDNISDRDYQWK